MILMIIRNGHQNNCLFYDLFMLKHKKSKTVLKKIEEKREREVKFNKLQQHKSISYGYSDSLLLLI